MHPYLCVTVTDGNFSNGLRPTVLPSKLPCAAVSCWRAADGESDNAIAQQLKSNRPTVRLWRARFAQKGLQGLWEVAPGRGRKATYGPKKIQQVIDTTLQSKPKGRTQLSCRSLAQRLGVSKSTVSNIT